MRLWYDPQSISEELHSALVLLGEEYPIGPHPSNDAIQVDFQGVDESGTVVIHAEGSTAQVRYHGLAQACRGVGFLLGLEQGARATVSERTGFETMGLMIDCSRNAVMRVEHVQRWLRRMALAGYDMLMLYTEDTYELPGEPLFGFLRGAYTLDEVQQIDRCARTLGIELIPCIQTLGHLEQILKWRNAYGDVRDTSSVLLVDEPKTYELIERMFRFWTQAVQSRRIHIGMDETHDLGRGRYLDRFGYRRGFDVFNAHLRKVVELCEGLGLRPMIWSDMYFRMGSETGNYYDLQSQIPDDVAQAIPRQTELVYWDYYHTTEDFYREWIRRHRAMGFEPVMGSGVWTWGRLVYSHVFTSQTALPCVRACLEEGLREVFFTMWKDDGGAVDFDSALAGVLYVAEAAYNGGQVDDAAWGSRFKGVCKADPAAAMTVTRMDPCQRYEEGEINSRMLLWDDPMLALYKRSLLARERLPQIALVDYYSNLADELSSYASAGGGASVSEAGHLGFAAQLAHTLALKTAVSDRLLEAYAGDDRAGLGELAEARIPQLSDSIEELWRLHRQVWMAQNKPFGFEVICIRYGGLLRRLEEVRLRLQEYLAGDVDRIDELEGGRTGLDERLSRYRSVATASSIL